MTFASLLQLCYSSFHENQASQMNIPAQDTTMIHTLQKEVVLGTTIGECWKFLQNPHNLNDITPPDLDFQIVSPTPEKMYNGLMIEYRIRIPLLGGQTWLTEIRHIRESESFVDEQRYGPFRFWHHFHGIEEVEAGVLSRDRVTYIMPFGAVGEFLHWFYVRTTLERIFSYRQTRLLQLFPG
ncbi:SRPBCC family protein [Desulfopila aestuarii]|uniref:Ligand-binding SRPBCC domain-containing protein n=1 Tax=Desulfopila aestuarii DSM 18488 TaxID=1121416 RepID=A0A1M7XVJ6_9BACT|nr:SRPBCC family protein [Desulfopila aestuarii]SHO42626.1 Ligand-binding SRPBCC domain-containing protein [Desulfopila aestuarii DSM 18488]